MKKSELRALWLKYVEEQKELLRALDETAAALLQRGLTRRELADRILKED